MSRDLETIIIPIHPGAEKCRNLRRKKHMHVFRDAFTMSEITIFLRQMQMYSVE